MKQEMIKTQLLKLAHQYPESLKAAQIRDVERIAFHIFLVSRLGQSLCDIGGGQGFFVLGCAALGIKSTLVDDFQDPVQLEEGIGPEDLYRSYGVSVVRTDVIKSPPDFPASSFDVVTSFDSIEHWHHSPKQLFAKVMNWLKPGGYFILGAPNCVNLRKRLTVPLGYGKWTQMEEWYDSKVFRGHVREPDVGDFRYIASDMGLTQIEILGRNWMAYCSRWLPPILGKPIDLMLRPFPSICSDLYLIGRKPEVVSDASLRKL
jgi:2-polyprenyl-3-methyl-5-hydroxy-6-metoxy-1,4-benzoquinol methylase